MTLKHTEEKQVTVYYVTKWATSQGVVEKLCTHSSTPDLVYDKFGMVIYTIGRDAFDNRADAEADVHKRITGKIKSLQGQIKKLERLL